MRDVLSARALLLIHAALLCSFAVTGCGRQKEAPASQPAAKPAPPPSRAATKTKPADATPDKSAAAPKHQKPKRPAMPEKAGSEAAKVERLGGVPVQHAKQGLWSLRRVAAPTPTAAKANDKSPPPDAARPTKEIDDNADFPAFLRYLQAWRARPEAAGQFKHLKVSDRRSVHVLDNKGVAVPMAVVDIKQAGKVVWRARTFGDGRLYFYPKMTKAKAGLPWQASTIELASRGKATLAATAKETVMRLPGTQPTDEVQLDIALVIDATASMGPAVATLQQALLRALKRLDSLGVKVKTQIGAVLYRDVGDDFLTAELPMMTDLRGFLLELGKVHADGGGDARDALDQGLFVAVDSLRWRRASAKVLFVLTDAGPKPEVAGDEDHTNTAIRAAALGIRTHVLALAGHDALATLAFRQIAQLTEGHFVPLPKPGAPNLGTRLGDVVFDRLRAELTEWTKPAVKR